MRYNLRCYLSSSSKAISIPDADSMTPGEKYDSLSNTHVSVTKASHDQGDHADMSAYREQAIKLLRHIE